MNTVKKILLGISIMILLYTRLVGLNWGLPYPMHPDERNMANAIQQLKCDKLLDISYWGKSTECFNPHFFAYGQFPLYLAYGVVGVMKFFDGDLGRPIGYGEAVMALRFISAVASIINVITLIKIIHLIRPRESYKLQIISYMTLTFSPYFIQLSHFGTTESLLMLFYTLIIYLSFKIVSSHGKELKTDRFLLIVTSGLATATKVSSVIFLAVPVIVIAFGVSFQKRQIEYLKAVPYAVLSVVRFFIPVFTVSVIFSPNNIISFSDFISSMKYESSVALGNYVAFYTRQFAGTIPAVFQFIKIFPHALGWPQYIFAVLGFFLLSWKNKYVNLLRFAFLVYFIPTSFMFAKWSRFMAPIFPVMSVLAVLFMDKIVRKFITVITIIIVIIIIIPGLAYLSVYQNPDVRFEASQWVYRNIPAGSKILSETANVVDIPIQPPPSALKTPPSILNRPSPSYQLASFNFYDLDENPTLPVQLDQLIEDADYIFIPSRRIFMNHSSAEYPLLRRYYKDLSSGKSGFKKIAEFSSYPRIKMFGKIIFESLDENAEETWSVFDHPVIRIYKKADDRKLKGEDRILNYESTFYHLPSKFNLQTFTTYHLLIADTPQKWERGLMYIRNKEDLGGLDGMLFQFPDKRVRTFWNKNTVSNLDLYWIDDGKIVGSSKLPAIGESGEITAVSSPQEIDQVVELL